MSQRDWLVLAAVFAPPLAVFWRRGFGLHFWLNLLLTLLAYIPGLIHAIWIINQAKR